MKVEISEPIEEIIFKRDGEIIARYFKATGSWESLTKKVEKEGHWGRFLVFEEFAKSSGGEE